MSKLLLEIACNSYGSCLNALKAGAGRIELFENLGAGGCTPSAGMLLKTSALPLPVYAMIRPRGGNFTYNSDETDIMLRDIEFCRKAGIRGIVFGCLDHRGNVDKELCKRLLQAWNGPATFHRAIDRSTDYCQAGRLICDLGFERILSSGGAADVLSGLEALKQLQKDLGAHIGIMPGGGVTAANAKTILAYTGCSELHATCKMEIPSETGARTEFRDMETISSEAEIRALLEAMA